MAPSIGVIAGDLYRSTAGYEGGYLLRDTLLSTLSRPQAQVLYPSLEEMAINTSALTAEMGTSRQNIHKLVVRSGAENIVESLITMRDFMQMEPGINSSMLPQSWLLSNLL